MVQRTIFLRRASVRGTSIRCSLQKMARRLPLLTTHKTMTLIREECSLKIAGVRLWDAVCGSRTDGDRDLRGDRRRAKYLGRRKGRACPTPGPRCTRVRHAARALRTVGHARPYRAALNPRTWRGMRYHQEGRSQLL